MKDETHERDTALLNALCDLVLDSEVTARAIEICDPDSILGRLLDGYGKLISVIASAAELPGDMSQRLASGYFEIMSKPPADGG